MLARENSSLLSSSPAAAAVRRLELEDSGETEDPGETEHSAAGPEDLGEPEHSAAGPEDSEERGDSGEPQDSLEPVDFAESEDSCRAWDDESPFAGPWGRFRPWCRNMPVTRLLDSFSLLHFALELEQNTLDLIFFASVLIAHSLLTHINLRARNRVFKTKTQLYFPSKKIFI